MPEEQLNEQLDKLAKGYYGKAMREYLQNQIDLMNTVKGASSVGYEELVGREIAVKYLEKVIRRITPSDVVDSTTSEYE